ELFGGGTDPLGGLSADGESPRRRPQHAAGGRQTHPGGFSDFSNRGHDDTAIIMWDAQYFSREYAKKKRKLLTRESAIMILFSSGPQFLLIAPLEQEQNACASGSFLWLPS